MTGESEIVFIENAKPPVRDGLYRVDAVQTIPGQSPGRFATSGTFVVRGERFVIDPTEIDSVFPPNLANGEFDGVLAQAVLTRRTLPWERTIDTPGSANAYPDAPWLAVLVFDAATAPVLRTMSAKDMVQQGDTITVVGSSVTGVGTMPASVLSYGVAVLGRLGYGETPDDPCAIIDIPVSSFNLVAPAAEDTRFLAHVREVVPPGGEADGGDVVFDSVVLANRIPSLNGEARAFLVSLEGMADYLPTSDGTSSPRIKPEVTAVRLLAYRSWSFTVNDMGQTLERLLESLNRPDANGRRVTTLTLPITGALPTKAQVASAMVEQAAGSLSGDAASVLMKNALLMGYVPFDHHLRHSGRTVSFYRGPLAPFAVPTAAGTSYSGADAANAYNPQTGMFDVSFGAAWQLGRLLALGSTGMANQLYAWKHDLIRRNASREARLRLARRMRGVIAFPSLFLQSPRDEEQPLPADVSRWFANLSRLKGVPFNYLVPDERMLPPESIRFFELDRNWLDALISGAFSIGNVSSGKSREDRLRLEVESGPVTGFIIRSQAVAGWPNLRVLGFDHAAVELPNLTTQLSADTTLCMFQGIIAKVVLREPPEQLHHGVEGSGGNLYTRLRSVFGGPGAYQPGQPYEAAPVRRVTSCDPDGTHAWTCIPARGDGRTLKVAAAARAIQLRLAEDFDQHFPQSFGSADFALELTKGVVDVEYRL